MRIGVGLGAELGDEQRERQHASNQPMTLPGQSQYLWSMDKYPQTWFRGQFARIS